MLCAAAAACARAAAQAAAALRAPLGRAFTPPGGVGHLSTAADPAEVDAVVVGAGVVGLAVGRALALSGREVLLLEAAAAPGTETSSRNSEVIHAGIYYPAGSLKAALCVEGRQRLERFCEAHGVPHRRVGKLLVATSEAQLPALAALKAAAEANGVADLHWLEGSEAQRLEPELSAAAALLSPSTGIVDSHSLMAELQRQLEEAGGTVATCSRVVSGAVGSSGGSGGARHRLLVEDAGGGGQTELAARLVVNAAGLHAQALSHRLRGVPPATIPPLHLAKGNYFSLSGKSPFSRLVYPLPEAGGLGVHFTLDLAGAGRFGPDVEWLPPGADPGALAYQVDAARAAAFYPAIRRYYPGLPDGALAPSYSGVRPKVSGPGEAPGDFVISGPEAHGVQGFVALYGLESPGLTACLAVADRVVQRLGLRPGAEA